ncbi:hypothetical protein D3C85_1902470 [compost metagenome]
MASFLNDMLQPCWNSVLKIFLALCQLYMEPAWPLRESLPLDRDCWKDSRQRIVPRKLFLIPIAMPPTPAQFG